MTELQPVITSVGGYTPLHRVSNQELITTTGIDSTPEWITERTGIETRYMAGPGETTAQMATLAATQALQRAGVSKDGIDQLLLATLTPDRPLPATSIDVHNKLGLSSACQSLDIVAACAGSVAALDIAAQGLQTGRFRRSLIVGAEVMTSVVDPSNRATSVIFGDGAGALLVENRQSDIAPVFQSFTVPDEQAIYIPHGGVVARRQGEDDPEAFIKMDGRTVAKYAKEWLPYCAESLALHAGMVVDGEIDWSGVDTVVFHQANLRLIESAADALAIPDEKLILTVQEHGNTSAASIPLAIDTAYKRGQLQGKQKAMLISIGAGFAVAGGVIGLDLPPRTKAKDVA
ncbi:MAG TPA: ketoacyl-ACP synthase III [Candidatus Saccharimonadales bacterium]|nr:ketoacyl-ACP synthase III [Candidatus Saccharimonadales bacterium]